MPFILVDMKDGQDSSSSLFLDLLRSNFRIKKWGMKGQARPRSPFIDLKLKMLCYLFSGLVGWVEELILVESHLR